MTEPSRQLKRNIEHSLVFKPKEGSELIGEPIEVLYEGPPDLGITLRPIKPQTMVEDGIKWTIIGGNKSGLFTLNVTTPTMVDAPLSLKAEQL
ncbi:hypothetical protein [Pseudomonas entomophila]|uniref:Uncharacterized protein n=1 Tax=Pseudomonas entomophila TaxID=312306 RepID=A0ABY9QN07_9PSED|nr:hypothetical protein [Pseudomonas entomophila]WMW05164.1 hypothetical protein RAH46_23015 [Pseudomonas entomophila]